MTHARKLRVSRLLCRALTLCVLLLTVVTVRTARAQVFAPECDETGASAIAPLPVLVRDHGEIRIDGCVAAQALLEPLQRAPQNPDRPTVSLESQSQLFLVEPVPHHAVPRARASRRLDPNYRFGAGAAHRQCVYRPPR